MSNHSYSTDRINAKVIKVIDGDTLLVSIDGNTKKIRLYGIDAPEMNGKCFFEKQLAVKAKNGLAELASNSVTLVQIAQDKYGRMLAVLFSNTGANINHQLVYYGLARAYPPSSKKYWCNVSQYN